MGLTVKRKLVHVDGMVNLPELIRVDAGRSGAVTAPEFDASPSPRIGGWSVAYADIIALRMRDPMTEIGS